MKIESLRLHLREYTLSDLLNFYRLKSNRQVWKYSTCPPVISIEEAKKILAALDEKQKTVKYGFHALFLKDKETFIGEAGIISLNENVNRCEIGYNLIPEYWNKGFATEITKELIRYAFQNMNIERIEALALKNNIASCRVLEKSGMKLEGSLRHFTKINDVYEDVRYYGIISSDLQISKHR
jgi:ribosomal-protein-alanine N-acetyltransferase